MAKPDPYSLPSSGAVLGLDVGFSVTRRSSAVCRLDWNQHAVTWTIQRFRADPDERAATIAAVAGQAPLLAAALDGPLKSGFEIIGRHRVCDRMLTRRLGIRIGKPGQVNVPVGRALNAAANTCARTVMQHCQLGPARHKVSIDHLAIMEAFPSTFLGVMLQDPTAITARRGNRSDLFYEHLEGTGELARLIAYLLPGRSRTGSLAGVTNHDDRAGLVCALTALSVAADDYTAVGDADGWVILPPPEFVRGWAQADLAANAQAERTGCLYGF